MEWRWEDGVADESAGGGGLAGRTLGDYRLIARLHDGATAELYRAEDAQLGRAVAVKVLKSGADEETVARFVEAARRMASLDHGNVVRVLASGEAVGRHYLAMPLLKESLRDRLARDGIPSVGEAARIVVQAAAGLYAAHTHGFAHGNLTPANILFDETGRVALTDFAVDGAGGSGSGAARAPWTADFAADPEAAGRAPAAAIAEDIYALGAVLYELLTGEQPVWRIGEDDASSGLTPPSARNPLIWPALDAVVLRAMAADPATRFADTRLFAQALRATVLVHLRAAQISGETAAVTDGAPRARFDARGAIQPSVEEMAALQGARRMDRRVLAAAIALALVIVVACAGSAFAVIGGFHFPGGSSYQGPGTGGSATLPAGQIAIVTATATATPIVTATATDTATPLASPTNTPGQAAPTMQFGGLRLQPQYGKRLYCVGVQSVTNTSPYPVSWTWSSWSPSEGVGYSFSGPSGYTPGAPSSNLDAGRTAQLYVRFACQTWPQYFVVNVTYWQIVDTANQASYSFKTS